MTRRAAIYTRQSLDRDGSGAAVDRQYEVCRELCERRGFVLVDTFQDNDISATSGKRRPEFERMVEGLTDDKFDVIVTWHYDRVTRTLRDHVRVMYAGRNTLIVGTQGDLDLATPSGRMIASMLAAQANYEVEHKGERQTLANEQRAKAGKPNSGRRPFGYDEDRTTVNEPEAALIEAAYADVLAGVKLSVITRAWRWSGFVPTQSMDSRVRRTEAVWTRNSVRDILLNPRNAGLREYKGEILGKAEWLAIVDEDTWRSVCAILEDPERRKAKTNARRWLLSGLAICGICSGPMKAHWSTPTNGTKRRRYLCRDKSCVSRTADLADIVVTQHIVKRLSRPDARELLVDKSQPNSADLMVQADTLRRRLDDMASAFADGEITRAQLATGTEKITAKLAGVEREMVHVDRMPLLRDLIEAEDVAEKWEALDLDRQRAVVAMLVKVTILPSPVGKRPQADSIQIEAAA